MVDRDPDERSPMATVPKPYALDHRDADAYEPDIVDGVQEITCKRAVGTKG